MQTKMIVRTDAQVMDVRYVSGEAYEVAVRGHRVLVDQPVDAGGEDDAPGRQPSRLLGALCRGDRSPSRGEAWMSCGKAVDEGLAGSRLETIPGPSGGGSAAACRPLKGLICKHKSRTPAMAAGMGFAFAAVAHSRTSRACA